MNAMTKASAMIDALETINDACAGLDASAAAPGDDVAARRALFEVHAKAARRVALYEFMFPQGASAPAINAPDQMRDAADQLHLVVALTGGAIARFPGGLVARVPVKAIIRFEALAAPLIADYLVALDRGDGAPSTD
jgi:hypothetical protein